MLVGKLLPQLLRGIGNGSIGQFLAAHGWQRSLAVTFGVSPPDDEAALFELEGANGNEYWIGYTNFYVISRYNPRVKYAMAVAQLSEEIRKLHGGPGS